MKRKEDEVQVPGTGGALKAGGAGQPPATPCLLRVVLLTEETSHFCRW